MTWDDKNSRTELESKDVKQRILDSAAHVFRSRGYSARLCDIADVVGIQTGSLYYYFKSREDLIEEMLEAGMRMTNDYVVRQLRNLAPDSTSLERLETAIRSDAEMLLKISDYGAAHNRIFSVLPDDLKRRLFCSQNLHAELFVQLYEDAESDGYLKKGLDLNTLRMLQFGAIRWSTEWYRPKRGRSAAFVIDQLVLMVMRGIQATEK